jgi:hypothetical protein
MADQSNFSNYPKKQLVFISNKLIEDGFEWDDITHNYRDIYDDNEEILQQVSSYFNEVIVESDVQFFIKFLEINSGLLSRISNGDKSMIEHLIIPQSKDYLIEYRTMGTCDYIEDYKSKFSSYDKHWIIDSLDLQRNNGDWDIYSGELLDTEYNNFEMSDWEINKVNEISNTQESRNPRKLLENTEKLIPKLDRDTLINLKFLIDKQLRGF